MIFTIYGARLEFRIAKLLVGLAVGGSAARRAGAPASHRRGDTVTAARVGAAAATTTLRAAAPAGAANIKVADIAGMGWTVLG